jgi:ethanolamine utilization protein EutP (predicted NTPase)
MGRVMRWEMKRIQSPGTIAPDDQVPGVQILYRKTQRIEFNGNIIINSKLPNRDKIFNNIRRD